MSNFFIFLSLFVGLSTYGLSASYTIKDLEILSKTGPYKEFLDHAHDLLPRHRDKKWSSLVQKVAKTYVNGLVLKNQISGEHFSYIEKIAHWPALEKNEFFLIQRDEFAIKFFKACLKKNKNSCLQKVEKFWSHSRKDIDTGFKIATLIEKENNGLIDKLITPAIFSDLSKLYCKKDFTKKILVKKVENLSLLNFDSSSKVIKKNILELMNYDCFLEIAKSIKEELYLHDSVSRESSYKILNAFKLMSEEEKDLFYAHFLLSGPTIGKMFNLSWSIVSKFSQDYDRRKSVLFALKEFDPLPDGFLKTKDYLKKRTLLKFLIKNLPEYFNFYAHTCLDFRESKKYFPQGNPTIHCSQFFESVKGEKFLSDKVYLRYSAGQKYHFPRD